MVKTEWRQSYDRLPEGDRAVLLALSVLTERIASLPRADRDDLFRLMQETHKTDDQEEQLAIRAAMEEILANAPVTVRELPPAGDLSTSRKKWAEHVGKTIKELRHKQNMTQNDLAEKAGIPQSHVSRLESAAYTPTHMTLQKIASALGVSVEKLDPCLD